MCLVLGAWQAHPVFALVIAANRDEVFRAPAQPLAWRKIEGKPILCGLDVRSGGTWMGLTSNGRFGAVTNVRQGLPSKGTATRSRGVLVPEFTTGAVPASEYAASTAAEKKTLGGFNLLIGDIQQKALWWSSNRSSDHSAPVPPGIHGLSNAPVLDAPWPKITGGTREFTQVLETDDGDEQAIDHYLRVLADRKMAPRRELPDTGVGLPLEKVLSARLVRMGFYGTRSSTVLRIRHDGQFDMTERRLDRLGRPCGDTRITGRLGDAPG